MIRGNRDKVIVKIEKPYEDTVQYGNLELAVDPEFNPTQQAKIYGEVVGIAVSYSDEKYEDTISIGDKVYFHFNVVDDSHFMDDLYSVEVDRIFCAIHGGTIVPYGDWCLLKPHKEHGEYEVINGKRIEVRKSASSGIITGIGSKASAEMAIVAHITDNHYGVRSGDLVYVPPHFEFENEIEGEKFFCVRKTDILGKIDKPTEAK